jgi:hypothetical protein
MPYVVFLKAPNLDYLRYMQQNDKQRLSKMTTVELFNECQHILQLTLVAFDYS